MKVGDRFALNCEIKGFDETGDIAYITFSDLVGEGCVGVWANDLKVVATPLEFEWCDTCKEYDKDKHCCHRWSKQIHQTVKELKETYSLDRNWIPCETKLPNELEFVLVTNIHGDVEILCRLSNDNWSNGTTQFTNEYVVAWQSKPKGYKGGENNG